MKIKYYGHSCFQLTDSTGITIVCDPYSPEVGLNLPELTADGVTVSHHHFDHDYTAAVGGNPKIMDGANRYDLCGVQINGIKSYHDAFRGKRRGENVIFKFRTDGLDICHFGDLGEECSAELVDSILPVDVLLIPVGGNYTIDAKTAKEYVDRLKPGYVIPMHFKIKNSMIDVGTVDEFTDLFDDDNVERLDSDEIELSRSGLNDKTRIIVLRRE